MLRKLNEINPEYKINSVNSSDFKEFGSIITGIDLTDMFPSALKAMNLDGPGYIPDIEVFHTLNSFQKLKNIFGELKIQAGICFGNNTLLNGMEYHKSSEVILAVTDMILMLGSHRDIINTSWDSSLTKIFYLPKGTVVELFGGTLHLAPVRVNNRPFCSIIVLPKGTNLPLNNKKSEDKLLFMKNKWLLCHPDSPASKKGAIVGIHGKNIKINTLK